VTSTRATAVSPVGPTTAASAAIGTDHRTLVDLDAGRLERAAVRRSTPCGRRGRVAVEYAERAGRRSSVPVATITRRACSVEPSSRVTPTAWASTVAPTTPLSRTVTAG
jgi:hypothetical protein